MAEFSPSGDLRVGGSSGVFSCGGSGLLGDGDFFRNRFVKLAARLLQGKIRRMFMKIWAVFLYCPDCPNCLAHLNNDKQSGQQRFFFFPKSETKLHHRVW